MRTVHTKRDSNCVSYLYNWLLYASYACMYISSKHVITCHFGCHSVFFQRIEFSVSQIQHNTIPPKKWDLAKVCVSFWNRNEWMKRHKYTGTSTAEQSHSQKSLDFSWFFNLFTQTFGWYRCYKAISIEKRKRKHQRFFLPYSYRGIK